ncbi:tetratricopeptide repeat protein [Flavivirga jejuensis]|uniref:Tetratricopeptide repeat protein n=1 Tax=Flavivirga jejuensis TaxID=870487 RepID=A0ABT8WRC7_9FLAO|nr:tetratricopeptide repeat protein [Flavivirga jejuensis]MDO5975674.1 tetratricopeptide repeat protein [Flavivirga jejuensis]
MKQVLLITLVLFVSLSFSQEKQDKEELLALKKANSYIYEGNNLITENDDFVSGEMAYRQAISKQPNSMAGVYNLGNAYYQKGNYEEALYRHEQAAKATTSKLEKHKAYHNIGNILMQNKKCKEAVEAFKNALRNNPTDNETRYNLGIAKVCAEEQKDQEDENKDDKNKDENKDDQDKKENEDKKDKEGDDKEDKKDEGDEEKKEGEDEKDDKGKPKDEKEDKGKEGDDKKKEQQKPKPQPGQMSPQQIKNLLEAMNNQEQKVQEKMNEAKEKGVKIKTEKDW